MSKARSITFKYSPGDVVDGHEVIECHANDVGGRIQEFYKIRSLYLPVPSSLGSIAKDKFEEKTAGK